MCREPVSFPSTSFGAYSAIIYVRSFDTLVNVCAKLHVCILKTLKIRRLELVMMPLNLLTYEHVQYIENRVQYLLCIKPLHMESIAIWILDTVIL